MTQQRPEVFDITVEHRTAPIDIATREPRFGWKVRGVPAHDAYRIIVEHTGRVVWDSGRVAGPGGVDVEYSGERLESDADYMWHLRVWNGEVASTWARQSFGTTLLDPTDWEAQWLTPDQEPTHPEHYTIAQIIEGTAGSQLRPGERLRPPLQIRQDVELAEAPARARIFVSSHGIHRLSINGQDMDDRLFEPGFDTYSARLSFSTYDITDALVAGTNTIGMTIADGWWAGRVGITGSSGQWGDRLEAIWQLSVTTANGRRSMIGSGSSAAFSARGGWDYADLYIGERYDSRAAAHGWSSPDFAHEDWKRVSASTRNATTLTPFIGEPVRRIDSLAPHEVSSSAEGFVIDLGQVIAGRLRVTLRAEAGTVVTIEHSEVLGPDGAFFDNILGPNKDQTDVYVCSGDGSEVYEPSFTFHGFRYARISASGPLTLDSVLGVVIASDLRPTAHLWTSDETVNRFHQNVLWSQRGNFLSIPTDCPQRERAGWTGDLQVFIDTAATTMDVRQFVERWLMNLRSEQFADGGVPVVIPAIPAMDEPRNVIQTAAGWSDAVVLVPWALWRRYGDRRALADNYDAMRRWIDFQQTEAERAVPERLRDTVLSDAEQNNHRAMWNTGSQFGDWLSPSSMVDAEIGGNVEPRLAGEIVAAAFHAHSTAVVAEIAAVLGFTDDEQMLMQRAQRIRNAFAAEYARADGSLLLDTQGAYVLALAFELLPTNRRAAAAARLGDLVRSNGLRLDTGFLSTTHLLDVLWDAGDRQLARDLFWQTAPPSWLYPVTMGATTVWESWEAVRPDGTPTVSSMNHYAFGAVDDWLFRRELGITPIAPGYGKILVQPDLDGPLDAARGSIDTVHGPVTVEWERRGDHVSIKGALPADTSGVLRVGSHSMALSPGLFSHQLDIATGLTADTRRDIVSMTRKNDEEVAAHGIA